VSIPDDNGQPMVEPAGMPKQDGSTARRLAINTVSNWMALGVQVLSGMFLLAYVLRHFGEEEFGLYRVALSITQAIGFLAFGMATANLRVATDRVAREDWDGLSNVLSVVRTLMAGAAGLGLAAVAVISFTCLGFFNVPAATQATAARLMQLAGIGSALQLVRIPYRSGLLAKQRYDLANAVLVGEVALRAGMIVACFELGWVRLEVLGLAIAVPSALGLIALSVMGRRVLPTVRLSFRRFTKKALYSVLKFSIWSTAGHISFVVQQSVAAPLIGATLGLAAVTAFAVPQVMAQYMPSLVGGFTLALWPLAAGLAVRGDRKNLGRLYVTATRFAMLLVVPILAVFVTHAEPLVAALKPELAWTHGLVVLCIGLSVLHCFGLSATHIIWGSGRIRGMVLSNVAVTIVGVMAALATVVWTDWGLYGVALGLFVPAALRGVTYMPILARRQIGVGFLKTIVSGGLVPLLGGLVPLAVGLVLRTAWTPSGLRVTMLQMGLSAVVYAPVAWVLILRADERRAVLKVFRLRRAAA